MSFFEYFPQKAICTKQAFSKQRRKLDASFFHDWNQILTESFYVHNQYTEWKNFKVLAVDGSSVILPDTEEMRSKYGYTTGQTENGSCVARICVLYDVQNQLALKGLLHSYFVSEEAVVL